MTYAVVWRESGGPEYAGRLALDATTATLTGRTRGAHEASRRLALAAVASVHLERGQGDRRLVVLTTDGRRFDLVSLDGPGTLHELAEQLSGNPQ